MKEVKFIPTIILSGQAQGVDLLGEKWATEHGIPLEYYPADWNKYGKQAGYIRNKEMVEHAEALIAVWDGESKGTKMTIDLARKKNLETFIVIVRMKM